MVVALCVLFVLGTTPEHYLVMMNRIMLPDGPGGIAPEEEFRPADIAYFQRYIDGSDAGKPQQVLDALHHLTSLPYLDGPVRAYLLAEQATWELDTQQETSAASTLNSLRQVVGQDSTVCMYVDLAQAKATAEGSGNFDEPFEPLTKAICRQYDLVFSKYDPTNRWMIEARLDFAAKMAQRAQLDHKHEIELFNLSISEYKKAQEFLKQLSADNSVAKDPKVQNHLKLMKRIADGRVTETEILLKRVQENREAEALENKRVLVSGLLPAPPGFSSSTENNSIVAAPAVSMPDTLTRVRPKMPIQIPSQSRWTIWFSCLAVAVILIIAVLLWRRGKRVK